MNSAEEAGRTVTGAARRAADNPALGKLARVGFAARGVLYALISVLALQIAFGPAGKEADKNGAVQMIQEQGGLGEILLWVMTVGLAALAVWQAGEALFSHGRTRDRVESALRSAFYVLLVVSLFGLLTNKKDAVPSTDKQSQDATAALLDLPGGQILAALAGLGVVALGVYWIHEGWTRKFMRDMTGGGELVRRLGQAGYIARGVIAVAAGILIGRAAIAFDAKEAVGIDGALKALAETPLGPPLLAVVALGLLLFAAYCFAEARWHRT